MRLLLRLVQRLLRWLQGVQRLPPVRRGAGLVEDLRLPPLRVKVLGGEERESLAHGDVAGAGRVREDEEAALVLGCAKVEDAKSARLAVRRPGGGRGLERRRSGRGGE